MTPISALVIDEPSLTAMQRFGDFDPDWFGTFALNIPHSNIRRTEKVGVMYFLSLGAGSYTPVVVFTVDQDGLFSALTPANRPEAFQRTIRAASTRLNGLRSLPHAWKQYTNGPLLSFQSNHFSTGEAARIELIQTFDNTQHTFVYRVSIEGQPSSTKPDVNRFRHAISHLAEAYASIRQLPVPAANELHGDFELTSSFDRRITQGLAAKQWYDTRLTTEQRRFVDYSLTESMRLKGAAGTGKTLSLVIKFLLECYRRIDSGNKGRFLFVTQSEATRELIQRLILDIDDRNVLQNVNSIVHVDLLTLHGLANEKLAYGLDDLQPLSLDGLDGKTMQLELIESLIQKFMESDWVAYSNRVSALFKTLIEGANTQPGLRSVAFEFMNEFACVLDAEGIKALGRKRETYLKEARPASLLRLDERADREVILRIYDQFVTELSSMGVVGIDQMIADFLGYLDSYRWDAVRGAKGYDAIFVDELHLFNKQECMVFQHLMADRSKSPIVIMAYDAKQSPRDTFVASGSSDKVTSNLWKASNLGSVAKFELNEVFRYTPEIVKALRAVDLAFPAINVGEDWNSYNAISQLASGPIPIMVEVKNVEEMYKFVFDRATRRVGRERLDRIAVLTMDEDAFDKYLNAGQFKRNYIPITSREDLSQLSNIRKRFILSMPEYVAGLQFDTVYLIDVNESLVPKGQYSAPAQRRFVSNLYLGASRAEKVLEIYADLSKGGTASVLNTALASGAITKKDAKSLS